MAGYRTVESQFWEHPVIRKATLKTVAITLFIITKSADDEGRFAADAWYIADQFSARHQIAKVDVAKAFEYLVKNGLLLLYGNGEEHGFLIGWYEHQFIRQSIRKPSSLPAPPVLCNSWEAVAQVVRKYCEAHEQQKTPTTIAVRWYNGLDNERQRLTLGLSKDEAALRLCVPALQEENGSSATVAQDERNGSASVTPRKEVEVEVEVDLEVEVDKGLAADAAASKEVAPVEDDATLFPPPAKEAPKETDVQRVIRECWEMLDLGDMPNGEGQLKGYSGLTQLFVADGWEVIERQVKQCFATKPQPTGNANPWAFFCKQFRLAVNQPWDFGVQKAGSQTSPQKGPIRVSDSFVPEFRADGSEVF